jgi:hypothetical protein
MGTYIKKLTHIVGTSGIYLLTMAALPGCSQSCTPDATVGKYKLKSTSDTYDLSLSKDGSGSLSRNRQSESISWEWANDQVFLHLSRELLEGLGNLVGHHTPPDAAKFQSGYFGLEPKCHAGHATELTLGTGEASFVKIN